MRQVPGQELGDKLLKSVREMKAGRVARVTKVSPNQVAVARLRTEPSQIIARKRMKEI